MSARTPYRRWRLPVLVMGILAMLLAACGGTTPEAEDTATTDSTEATGDATTEASGDGGTEAGEVIPVSFGASAGTSAIGLLANVIKGEGIDAEHGLDMQISEFAPDQAEQAILTGQVDTGFFALVSWAKVQNEGEDIALLAPLMENHGAVLVPNDSPAQTLEDLKGSRIATLSPVSGLYTSMQVLAAELGLSWENDFEVISGPPPGLVAFLENGDVDAIVHFEPTVSQLLATGNYRVVMTPSEAWREQTGEPLFMLGVAAQQSWVDDNPEAAQRVIDTIRDATSRLSEDPDLIEEYQEELKLSDDEIAIAKERMSGIYIPEPAEELDEDVRMILDRSVELGVIEDYPDRVFTDLP
jgi:NitT/TauT family transport system substrate-binding protein